MKTWLDSFKGYLKPAVFIFFFLGFSCGLPFSLIAYSLSLWMRDVGVDLAVIGVFSLVLLPYNFKFLWAPLVDQIKLPFLASHLGQKKAWLFVFQVGLILSVLALSYCDPAQNTFTFSWQIKDSVFQIPLQTYAFALLVAFFAASQDIVVDALRIDTLLQQEQGEGAGMYQFGYRMGMFLSGAGVVAVCTVISWQLAYFCVGCLLSVGLTATFFIEEPVSDSQKTKPDFKKMVIDPFCDFMQRKSWLLFLIFIVAYKLCNSVLGRMALPFYSEMGFSKSDIALVSGTLGPVVTILGVALGGVLVMRYHLLKLLFVLGFVEIATSIAFGIFSLYPQSLIGFIIVIMFDNVVGGMGGAVFVAFLSSLCSKSYSATQYALLTSFMMVASSVVSMYSGVWATQMGWMRFFLFTGVLMIPALCLLGYLIMINALKK